MANLKDLRVRISSVKSTRKITSAMKMVAASKLRRAQSAAEAARPYAERMERMVGSLAANLPQGVLGPALLSGNGNDMIHLVVLVTSDRGLCGGFNSYAVRNAKQFINEKLSMGKEVRILCVGRKGRDQLKRDFGSFIIDTYEGMGRKGMRYADALEVAARITKLFEDGQFDVATLIYNRFKSAISQVPTRHQMIPFEGESNAEETGDMAMRAMYEMEPEEQEILAKLLPRNLATQVFRSLLESFASEQGARMTAMDNATRNAGDMLNALTLRYNRTRQANITKELIEIISGAEAL